ncbi:hypothetical protein CI1B_85970 [Bradyrhizobium ivorense]|uniref:Uncharacterized protein n=2 Tax=Bradyrhizobium ivorense TaxID=2511166 RepID=A0A508U283_9BRAD|nr:hypothetical protein CI1B_85970 [Bradyrhizobium ivorense]
MTNAISDAAVALSLMRQALSLLDGPEHAKAAALLRAAIEELSRPRPTIPPREGKDPTIS